MYFGVRASSELINASGKVSLPMVKCKAESSENEDIFGTVLY